MNYSDAELKAAAELVRKALLNSLPDMSDYKPEYSPAFTEKMNQLFIKLHKRERLQRFGSQVAAILFTILLISNIWLLTNIEVVAVVKVWVREIFEDSFVYRYFIEQTNDTLKYYDITKLPIGYDEVVSERNDTSHFMMYQKDDSIISFMYYKISDGTAQRVFAAESESITINGNQGDIYFSDDGQVIDLVFIDEKDGVVFWVSSDVKKEILVELAKSIKERRK